MFEWLAWRSGENVLTAEQQVIFWTKFGGYSVPVQEKKLSILEARALVKNIVNTLKSKTTQAMRREGYVFDGLLGHTGGGKALLYHMIKVDTGEVVCGKVYSVGVDTEAGISAEVSTSEAVHAMTTNPHIVKYSEKIDFAHHTQSEKRMVALVMPLYEMSLATVLEAFDAHPLPHGMFTKVVNTVLAAASTLRRLDLAHCDIKPENIMLRNTAFTVIDLGSVVKLNSEAREYTHGYYLDSTVHKVSPEFDLNCILTTLVRCSIPEFTPARGMTRLQLRDVVNQSTLDVFYTTYLDVCFSSRDCEDAYCRVQNLVL